MPIVHEIAPGEFVRWPSGHPIMLECRRETVIVRRIDGTEAIEGERDCEPYLIEERVPEDFGEAFWQNHSDAELAARKLTRIPAFKAPAGMRPVGEARYEPGENGAPVEVFDVEEVPPPPPPPTFEEKLAEAGITNEEFEAKVSAIIAKQVASA